MKWFQIFLFFFIHSLMYAQTNNTSNNTEIEISSYEPETNNRPQGVECGFGGGFCSNNFSLIDPGETSNTNFTYGNFYIDEHDSLKLSIEKNTISLNTMVELFGENKFDVETQFHIPVEITNKLGIEPMVVKNGFFNVHDSKDNNNLIIDFGEVVYLSCNKTQNTNGEMKQDELIEMKKVMNDRE